MDKPTVLIADPTLETLPALLEGTCRVYVVADGVQALNMLSAVRPDVLVLDLMLPGLDGITLLQKAAKQNICPAVLATTWVLSDYVSRMLGLLDVGYVMRKPCDAQALSERIGDLLGTAPKRKSNGSGSRELLQSLGVPSKLKGFGYLHEAVQIFAEDPGLSITKELYFRVAKRCDTTPSCVERSIRNAIEAAFARGDAGAWRRHFPSLLSSRPSNGAFVAQLAQSLRHGL